MPKTSRTCWRVLLDKDGALVLNMDDDIVAGTVITHNGQVLHEGTQVTDGIGVKQWITASCLASIVFLLAIFLGIELIGRVPATLHTPLMSGTNAIHGIVLLGGMVVLGEADTWWLQLIGFLAVVLGAANVFGAFVVTDRMLEMFKGRKPTPGADNI